MLDSSSDVTLSALCDEQDTAVNTNFQSTLIWMIISSDSAN